MINRSGDRDGRSLQIQRLVPASPERVFRAWTDPQELTQWWGPANVSCPSADVDLRVGGTYRISNKLADGSLLWIVGEYEVVERPRLLVYTWAVESKSPTRERVTVRFEEHDQGTQLTINHELISSAELYDQHRHGWKGCVDGLVEHLAG